MHTCCKKVNSIIRGYIVEIEGDPLSSLSPFSLLFAIKILGLGSLNRLLVLRTG